MSSPEDTELDEYLRGNSDISRRYRSIAEQQPPAALDQAVLAQARAAAQTPTSSVAIRRPARRRWIAPFAAAATMLLTVAIFRHAGIDTGGRLRTNAVRTNAPGGSTTGLTTDVPPQSAEPPSAKLSKKSEIAGRAQKPAAAMSAQPQLTPPSAAAPKSAMAQAADAQRADSQRTFERQTMEPARRNEAAPPAAASAHSPIAATAKSGLMLRTESRAYLARERVESEKDKAANPQPITAETWLDNIRNLRADGQRTEAEAELQSFLETYPDYFIKNPTVARP